MESAGGIITGMKEQDVTSEYLRAAKPNEGAITYDEGYDVKLHQDEIDMAEWLHNTFGGDIQLLKEVNEDKHKTPDYLWRGKMWDLKKLSSEKAANSALRHGLQQIRDNPGGIFLDFQNWSFSLNLLLEVIDKRVKWYRPNEDEKIDILIISDGKLFCAIRYKN